MTGLEVSYRYVADLGRAIAFYEAAFGLAFDRYGDDWAECTLPDGVRFGFHLAHHGAQPQTPGTVMVDLRVNDLAAAHARLTVLGATPGDPQDAPTGRFVSFLDPDGYRVQVSEKSS